jgi:predicted amidohydrolase
VKPSEKPPRKLVIATCKADIAGNKQERVAGIDRLIAVAEAEAERRFGQRRLDLVVLPECALHEGRGNRAREQAIAADDPAVAAVGAMARRAGAYVVLPAILRERTGGETCANAALLLDRDGKVAGIYRKVHPVAAPNGVFENGVTPGREFPVFDCDFGRLGIQICWDMVYDEGWQALAAGGAELVALPSASPQTVRPAACAQRFRLWVVTSTPRDNAGIYNPAGIMDARTEQAEVLVHRIDLSAAVVHWNAELEEGRAFARAFGDRGEYRWSLREDTGLFWSNDPSTPVASMLRELGIEEMDAQVARIGHAVRATAQQEP